MPRSTLKSRHNVYGKAIGRQTTADPPTSNVVSKTVSEMSKRDRALKKEPGSGTETITEQVCHRKSERRRVARDIFLVFEEQPSSRRLRGSNKKQAKPKFGHLRVEDTNKPKGLLRDIKNEPKCYLSSRSVEYKTLPKEASKTHIVNTARSPHFDVWSSTSCSPCKSVCTKAKIVEHSKASKDAHIHSMLDESPVVARVNPIFLWAKQDDSRIVEVRCEDYDKRNRIRITKTSNGWRAIPRSDPTSSKVLKLYTSPLIKVKRESHINVSNHISQTPAMNFCIENKPIMDTSDINTLRVMEEPSLNDSRVGRGRVSSKKSKKKKSKKRKEVFTCRNVVLCSNSAEIKNSHQTALPKLPLGHFVNNNFPSTDCYENDACVADNDDRHDYPLPTILNSNIQQITNISLRNSSPFEKISTDDVYVDGSFHDECSLQLCPKTGLFLRNTYRDIKTDADDELQIIESNSSLDTDRHKKLATETKQFSIEENHESLEAKTRNLKDLLDDADLFQHCDDNANSDADLIDTLVKSSCESNLLHDTDSNVKDALDATQNKARGDSSTESEELAQLITDVSEPPKCLSFNEAGEIEALNCELFQSNGYMGTFEKHTSITVSDTQHSMNTVASMQPMSVLDSATQDDLPADIALANSEKTSFDSTNIVEDSPKDLSYKKREEVCPPSESRSQCAVTSSSDIIKSPNLGDSSVLASSSETLKHLIIEQFIKLNTISSHTKNPIELKKQAKTITHLKTMYAKSLGTPSNDIETVVIDDDDGAAEVNPNETEPLKKRLRSTAVLTQHKVDADVNIKAKMVMIDKDPDPLTQLRLLIENSQWKVPDPILVPKDRLSAVLASPAREIPLLITTRPELRLPEAFAYPEIIQNPNILVISMAQLEAILKNDLDINKCKLNDQEVMQASSLNFKHHPSQKFGNDFLAQTQHKAMPVSNTAGLHQEENGSTSTIPMSSLSKEETAKCSHIGSSNPSEINAATMAVLNQMLWLPYFGQISQDFMKSIKTSHNLTDKMSLVPFCATQNLESMCEKNTQTSLSSLHQVHGENSSSHYGNMNIPSVLKQGQIEEMTLFQKVLQHQMQNTVNASQSKTNVIDPQNISNENAQVEPATSNQSSIRVANNKSTYSSKNKDVEQSSYNILDIAGKTYNLRSSIASRQSSDLTHYSNIKRLNCDNKPRVTCKSLSNLLDPEHSQPHNMSLTSSTSIPVVSNVATNFLQDVNSVDNKNRSRVREQTKDNKVIKSLIRSCNSSTADISNEYKKQNNKMVEDIPSETVAKNVETSMVPTETNVPLWHPLFGSNSKSAYSSPWQWTTVTAAGE